MALPAFADVDLLLMNPLAVTDGFEGTVTASGVPCTILQTTLPVDSLDIDPSVNGFAVGAATPFVVDRGAMLLCPWQFMVLDAPEARFFITRAAFPSLPGDLPVVTGNGVLRRCGVASGEVGMAVATVNPPPDQREVSTFGAVKSLFRQEPCRRRDLRRRKSQSAPVPARVRRSPDAPQPQGQSRVAAAVAAAGPRRPRPRLAPAQRACYPFPPTRTTTPSPATGGSGGPKSRGASPLASRRKPGVGQLFGPSPSANLAGVE